MYTNGISRMEKNMNNKLKSVVAIFFGFFSVSFATANEVPSYTDVLEQQFKCNSHYFSNVPWDKKLQLIERMDNSIVVVISKPVVTELPSKVYQNVHPDYKNRKERSFKISSISYDFFTCGQKTPLDSRKNNGIPVEAFIDISETKTGSGTFNISDGKPDDEGSFLFNTSNNGGMYCLVLLDDFLKNSNAINIDKLCKGKKAIDREITKKAIEQTRNAWLAAGVGKLK
jgi:hypothetical protein